MTSRFELVNIEVWGKTDALVECGLYRCTGGVWLVQMHWWSVACTDALVGGKAEHAQIMVSG